MLMPPYPATFRLGQAPAPAPAPAPVDNAHVHWEPAVILFGGALTIGGLILQARGAKNLGTLAYVSAVLLASIVAAMRCYR